MNGKEIGDVLRLCRERKGWSQKELAQMLRKDQASISRAETGRDHVEVELAVEWGELTDSSELIALMFTGKTGSHQIKMMAAMMTHIRTTLQMYEMLA